jgi:acetyl esterase/lipase
MNLAQVATQMHHRDTPMENTTTSDRLAEHRYRKLLKGHPEFVWREFGDGVSLKTHIIFPQGHCPSSSAPSVIFFHGGMWTATHLVEFVPWALQLAERGIVGILPEYRTPPSFQVSAQDMLQEAREAWQWTYDNATELGLDPTRIAVAGSDIGGLMALHVTLPDQPARKRWFHSQPSLPPGPAAVILFRAFSDATAPLLDRLLTGLSDEERRAISPMNRLQRGLPPLFASHGGKDRVIDPAVTESLCKQWKKNKNQQYFARLDLADHSFYHFNVNARFFEYLLAELDDFMVSQKIWEPRSSEDSVLIV